LTLKEKHETSFYLKGILKNIKRSNTTAQYNVSKPEFIFSNLEKETLLMEIITNLEKEIYEEERESHEQKRNT
jgi:hypothetical protein